MACTRPLKAYRTSGGGVSFSSREGFTDRPLEFACGQCLGCRIERTRQWATRCVHEALLHDANSFITLTYDDAHLPRDGSLHLEHWQKFMKRLRKKVGKVRYFACGEYGAKNGRPHYHACLFGYDFSADRVYLKGSGLQTQWHSDELFNLWGQGLISIGQVTYQSARYVAEYILDKKTGKEAEHHYEYVCHHTGEVFPFKPEFVVMSKNKGIGHNWLKRFRGDVYPIDEVRVNGKPLRPPKYYDKQLQPEELVDLKKLRRQKARLRASDNTPERLRQKERHMNRQHELKQKKL